MQKTQNLKLNKPDYTDVADIADLNANMDIIDEAMLEHKHNAVEITANTNLNDIDDEGYYWCTSGNAGSVTNKPDGITFFGLRVNKISGGVFSQELTTSDNRKFIRIHWSGAWTEWTKFSTADDLDEKADTGHKHTKSDITDFPQSLRNPQALTISLNGTSQGSYDGSAVKNINITAQSVGASASNHTHSLADTDITGILPVSKGGTGNSGFDTAPTSGSSKMVTSGGVYDALGRIPVYRGKASVEMFDSITTLCINADLNTSLKGSIFLVTVALSNIENSISLDSSVSMVVGSVTSSAYNCKGNRLLVSDIAAGGYTASVACLLCCMPNTDGSYAVHVINA